MPLVIGNLRAGILANVAFERLQAAVLLSVPSEVAALRASEIALGTFVRFFRCVRAHVPV